MGVNGRCVRRRKSASCGWMDGRSPLLKLALAVEFEVHDPVGACACSSSRAGIGNFAERGSRCVCSSYFVVAPNVRADVRSKRVVRRRLVVHVRSWSKRGTFFPISTGESDSLLGTSSRRGIDTRPGASFRGSWRTDPFPIAVRSYCPRRILSVSSVVLVGSRAIRGVVDAPPWSTSVDMAAFVDVQLLSESSFSVVFG